MIGVEERRLPEKPARVSEFGSWFSLPCPPIPLPSLLVTFLSRASKGPVWMQSNRAPFPAQPDDKVDGHVNSR